MSLQVGSFKEVVFEVSSLKVLTFETFNRDTKATYFEHKVAGGVPILEKTGRELETIAIDMTLHAGLGITPFDEVQKLRQYLKDGEKDFLIIGNHAYTENAMVITNLSESVEVWDSLARHYAEKVKVTFKESPEIYY